MNPYPFPTENPYPWPTDLPSIAFTEPSAITLANLQASIQSHPIAWFLIVVLFAIAIFWIIARRLEDK